MRAVVWTQGCSLGCPGCFNPATHAFAVGQRIATDELARRILAVDGMIEGATVSGGEPLQQFDATLALLRQLRQQSNLSTILFTGFRWEEILTMPRQAELFTCVDVLLAGRYDARQRLARGLRGSANKTAHFLTDRYTAADLDAVSEAEVLIGSDGKLTLSGIEPVLM